MDEVRYTDNLQASLGFSVNFDAAEYWMLVVARGIPIIQVIVTGSAKYIESHSLITSLKAQMCIMNGESYQKFHDLSENCFA